MRRARRLSLILVMMVPQVARAQGGNPTGLEFRVNTYTTNRQDLPALAREPGGGFVVVWNGQGNQDGSQIGVFGQRYASSGATLGLEFRVNTYTTGDQDTPSVAADAAGNFVVLWESYGQDGSGEAIFGQRYASSGAPLGAAFRANSYTTNEQARPSVAADSTGNFVVVWNSYLQDGSYLGIFGQRYASSGAPTGPEFRVNSHTTDNQRRPAVAAFPAGGFVVVWDSYGQDGSDYGVFGQRYAGSGAPAGPAFLVNSFTTGEQSTPSVAADPAGNFIVVWKGASQDGSGDGVFGQRYASSGAPLGAAFRVNSFTTGPQSDPVVAADSFGNFVVAWQSYGQDGSLYGIFGQRYASSGATQGGEFRVNTFATGQQYDPVVGADAVGNFVVAWSSFGQDGSLSGVFSQRYAPIVPVELMQFGVE
jgi:hypothetical protein